MNRIRSMVLNACGTAYAWRRVLAVVLVTAVVVGVILPTPGYSQLGLIGSIQNVLNIINGAIRTALNLIRAVSQSLEALYQEIVWPVRLIDEAKSAIASLIEEFRSALQSIYTTAREQRHAAGADCPGCDHSKSSDE